MRFLSVDLLSVEFPRGPLAIGSAHKIQPEGEIQFGEIKIKLFSPTQCVMDRLAAWYHWNDTQALEQALLVAQEHPIKLMAIEQWSANEGDLEKYKRFLGRLKALKK